MGCCDKKKSVDDIYIPINRRLVDFALQLTDPMLLHRFPATKLFIFTFVDRERMCTECTEKFGVMLDWFNKYGLMSDPINNVKWIFEDEMAENHIVNDIGITKSPTHLICDGDGNIKDIVAGFPSAEWLEKHFLQLLRN